MNETYGSLAGVEVTRLSIFSAKDVFTSSLFKEMNENVFTISSGNTMLKSKRILNLCESVIYSYEIITPI